MPDQEFIYRIQKIILENIANEEFGVADLAEKYGISRSTLLRKMQKETGKPASQFIKQIRLEESKKFLKETDLNISEIGFRVGFNSTSYFIKCFKEEYGISPGEFQKLKPTETETIVTEPQKRKSKRIWIASAIVLPLIFLMLFYISVHRKESVPLEKSIAVLPFINDSKDSSNVYIVNGLMDAILNNLQKIKDLRVISRTSMEKYRNSNKSIPEIAEELGVSYFVEGSGQKVGDQIMLNVQLIEARRDRHIWAEQYNRQLTDIFMIQRDIASKIAHQVQAKITPEEQKRIEEMPTSDIVAYDYFLQGLEFMYQPSESNLNEAIQLFNIAVERDEHFARAYAALAMAYYYLDIFQVQKKYVEQINFYAEKAYLMDPQLSQSLVAKAFSYMIKKDYQTAVSYLEKAIEIHPNSAFVLNFLSDFYTNYIPNTEKYLEYSLRGMQLDKSLNDSIANSYLYLHVSNAFLQTGFLNEAELFIKKSLAYNPQNIYSLYVKPYIQFAHDKDIGKVQRALLEVYQMDTTRLDVIQELAKTYYNLRDYQNAYLYYKKLMDERERQNFYLFVHEDIKIAWVCKELGFKEKAEGLLAEYKAYAESDQSIYQPLLMSGYYSYIEDKEQALSQLRKFSQAEGFHIWTLFLPNEPHMQAISSEPEFLEIMKKLEIRFWENHDKLKTKLQSEGLI